MSHLQTNEETHGEVKEHPETERLISSPIPLSWIRNRSPDEVTWYSGGNSGRASLTTGLGWWYLLCCCDLIFVPKWFIDGRLTATASETFCTSALTISLGLPKLSHALLLIFSFILVVSHFVAEGGCVCSLTWSTKLSNSSSLTEARHSPFLLSSHSHEVILFASCFLNKYVYPSFKNFLAPRSVVVNSVLLYRN